MKIPIRIKDPFARKMFHGSLIFASVLALLIAALTTVYLHVRPRCSDDVVLASESPDRQWIATAMQRRCGEESPFLTHVNLRPANRSLQYGFFSGKAEDGEVFVVEREAHGLPLALIWDSPSQLTIRCSNCPDASRRQKESGKVVVRYQLAQDRP